MTLSFINTCDTHTNLQKTSQELITRVPESTGTDIRDAVRSAEEAFKGWRRLPLAKRRSHLLRLIELIRSNEMDLVGYAQTYA